MIGGQSVNNSPIVIPRDVLDSLSPFHWAILTFTARKYPHLVQIAEGEEP